MKITRPIAWVLTAGLVAAGTVAAVQRPGTGASTAAAPRVVLAQSPARLAQVPGRFGRPPRNGMGFTEEEWERTRTWMQANSPNRLAFLERMPDPGRQFEARRLAVQRFRQIERVQYDPLHDAMLAEVKLQDEVFGDMIALRRAHTRGSSAAQAAAESSLQRHIADLFDAQINEKQVRLKRLQKEIDDQRAGHDRLIKNWYDSMRRRAEHSGPPPTTSSGQQEAAPDEPADAQ